MFRFENLEIWKKAIDEGSIINRVINSPEI
jgi:hypothetical protein